MLKIWMFGAQLGVWMVRTPIGVFISGVLIAFRWHAEAMEKNINDKARKNEWQKRANDAAYKPPEAA